MCHLNTLLINSLLIIDLVLELIRNSCLTEKPRSWRCWWRLLYPLYFRFSAIFRQFLNVAPVEALSCIHHRYLILLLGCSMLETSIKDFDFLHLQVVRYWVSNDTFQLRTIGRYISHFWGIFVHKEGKVRWLIFLRDWKRGCQYWTVYYCVIIFWVIWINNQRIVYFFNLRKVYQLVRNSRLIPRGAVHLVSILLWECIAPFHMLSSTKLFKGPRLLF